jgi:hypothetical protein
MDAAEPQTPGRGASLLMEHCAALDTEHGPPTARERLERIVGGHLAHLLVGALGRNPRRDESD